MQRVQTINPDYKIEQKSERVVRIVPSPYVYVALLLGETCSEGGVPGPMPAEVLFTL